jgi:hypothetical protein
MHAVNNGLVPLLMIDGIQDRRGGADVICFNFFCVINGSWNVCCIEGGLVLIHRQHAAKDCASFRRRRWFPFFAKIIRPFLSERRQFRCPPVGTYNTLSR